MNKPTLFESVMPCSGEYSLKRDLRLNAWLLVAAIVYCVQLSLVRRHPEWSSWLRAVVALAPLFPALLYIRSWVRFIRELDELQRQIQLGAHVFAAWGTLVIAMILTILNQQGALTFMPHGLGFGGVMLIQFPLWLIGLALANRRYR